MDEQNAQVQKKLYNKITSMPSKSSAATSSVCGFTNYTQIRDIHEFEY